MPLPPRNRRDNSLTPRAKKKPGGAAGLKHWKHEPLENV